MIVHLVWQSCRLRKIQLLKNLDKLVSAFNDYWCNLCGWYDLGCSIAVSCAALAPLSSNLEVLILSSIGLFSFSKIILRDGPLRAREKRQRVVSDPRCSEYLATKQLKLVNLLHTYFMSMPHYFSQSFLRSN